MQKTDRKNTYYQKIDTILKSEKNGQLLFGKAIVRQNGQKWPPFETEIKSAENTTQKKDSKTTSELFYTENGYKKQVIVKTDTILKCCKSGHFAKATRQGQKLPLLARRIKLLRRCEK